MHKVWQLKSEFYCFYSSLGMKTNNQTFFDTYFQHININDTSYVNSLDGVWDDTVASTEVADLQMYHQNPCDD